MDGSRRALGLARRRQHRHDAYRHQSRHDGIRHVPAVAPRQQQGHGARHEHGRPVSPLVGRGHGALPRHFRRFDTPRVNGDVLGGGEEPDEKRQDRHGPQACNRIGN